MCCSEVVFLIIETGNLADKGEEKNASHSILRRSSAATQSQPKSVSFSKSHSKGKK